MKVDLAISAFCFGVLATCGLGGFAFGYVTGVADTRVQVEVERLTATVKPKPPVPSNRCYLKEAPHANA